MTEGQSWSSCTICKGPLAFSQPYFVCSVSGCQVKRKRIRFCSARCWDEHRAVMGHRDAFADERIAPSLEQHAGQQDNSGGATEAVRTAPQRKVIGSQTSNASAPNQLDASKIPTEVLVVVSKTKKLIKDQSGFSTSQCCIEALTRKVVHECMRGIEQAKLAGRKTVMGRDIH